MEYYIRIFYRLIQYDSINLPVLQLIVHLSGYPEIGFKILMSEVCPDVPKQFLPQHIADKKLFWHQYSI